MGSGGHQNKAYHRGSTSPLEEGVSVSGMGLPSPEVVMETTQACFLQRGLWFESYLSHFISVSYGFNTGDESRESHAQGSERIEESQVIQRAWDWKWSGLREREKGAHLGKAFTFGSACSVCSCVTLGKTVHLSEPRCPHLYNGNAPGFVVRIKWDNVNPSRSTRLLLLERRRTSYISQWSWPIHDSHSTERISKEEREERERTQWRMKGVHEKTVYKTWKLKCRSLQPEEGHLGTLNWPGS